MTYTEIPDIIRQSGFRQWKIYKTTRKDPMLTFENDPERDVELEIKRMDLIMANVYGESFELKANKSEQRNAGGGWVQMEFTKINPAGINPQYPQVGNIYRYPEIGTQGVTREELKEMLKEEREAAKREAKVEYQEKEYEKLMKELREEERAFRQERDSALNLILAKVGEVIPRVFPKIGLQTAVAGMEDSSEAVIIPANIQNDKLENLINEWITLDPDCPQLIEKIVNLCKSNKVAYTTAKNMLLTM